MNCEVASSFSYATPQVWVRIPTLNSTADTSDVVIYVWYHYQSGPIAQPPANNATWGSFGVWDSNFVAVYHLENAASPSDSTGNAYSGTNNGCTTVTGEIGNGAGSFSGTNNIALPSTGLSGLTSGSWTAELWLNPSSYVPQSTPICFNNDGLIETNSTNWGLMHAGNNVLNMASATISTGGWQYVAASYSSSATAMYLNGTANSGTLVSDTGYNMANEYYLGSGKSSSSSYAGQMDEVRISSTVRSAAWIQASFNNQNSASSFSKAAGAGNNTAWLMSLGFFGARQ